METLPVFGGIMPAEIFSSVLLPAPFVPTIARKSPLAISRLTESSCHCEVLYV